MPLTKKGERILQAMRSRYGDKRGTEIFYASANAKTITGVEEAVKKPRPSMIPPVRKRR